jgi:DNA-binding response OmpR family regulator
VATVVVVADDLMWSERLATQGRAAGAEARTVSRVDQLGEVLASAPDLVVVDLSGRSFDGLAAVTAAAAAGVTVIAVAQHEEHDLRRRALAAGAQRVYAYAKMHADGATVLAGWLSAAATEAPATQTAPGRS